MRTGRLLAGRYRLRRQVGVGGMSVVWCAHDEVLGRDVAVKMLAPHTAADPAFVDQVHREARAVAALHHPNIVEVYDYGQDEAAGPARPYVVMELVDGPSLAQLFTGGALPWPRAVAICAQVAAALTAAHARGIVHRDVKPGNVLVTEAEVKLVDFGISATTGEPDDPDGQVLGTPAYLAPERIDGAPVSPAADVYSLGLLLYRALAGRMPWPAATTVEMLVAHREQEPAPLPPIAQLPPEVVRLCRRCLHKRPQDRPDAAEAARVLGLAAGLVAAAPPQAHLATGGARPAAAFGADTGRPGSTGPATKALANPFGRPRRRPGRRRTALGLSTAAAVLVSGAAGAVWLGDETDAGQISPLAAPPAAVAAPKQPEPRCEVRYAVRRAVGGKFSAAVTVANTGTAPISDWRLTFTFPAEQELIRGWNARWRQVGRTVQATGGDLPARASAATRLDGTYRETTALPAEFRLNGTACATVLSAADQTVPPARTTAHRGNGGERKNNADDRDEKGEGKKQGKGRGPGKGNKGKRD
ncbi:serine/threonine-protein kinase [Couchioplanes azureus]|uniref:serine/threonine-protein kinase n=1 Tax=Couchioplanes caeruleus TaxID=56438 RepID=UPI00167022ED|nr:serine/threonine-protein kinase [Couchioplanes caeruleus]